MNENIRRLVQMQGIASEIKEVRDREARAPERLSLLEESFRQKVEEIGSARLTYEALVTEQHRLVHQREEMEARHQQAQQKLMQVNNPREYSAVLNEIDAAKGQIGAIADKLREIQAQLEELAGPAAEADERIAAVRTTHESEKRQLEEEREQDGRRLRELDSEREALKAVLPREFLSRFDTIFSARGGLAVARIEGNACGACHVRLRPQIITNVRRGDDLSFCESCRRILYIADAESAADEPPANRPDQGLTPAGA